jgi:mannose-1-phosphate guanylyltransferase / mannose-6-phosphate isomerase
MSADRSTTTTITPVILCGGSGTRLWPLSRKALPKQFVPLIGGKSLLQLTLERSKVLGTAPLVVASEEHRFLVQETTQAAGVNATVVLEPAARNTAAAMALAALQVSPDALLLFLPADHHIPDAARFCATVLQGANAAQAGNIVTFGVAPTCPSTAYGYIHQGAALPGDTAASQVKRFAEKPASDKAQTMLLDGGYFWNAGIFLCKAETLLGALSTHAPDILASCREAVEQKTVDGAFVRIGADAFNTCRSESIDCAVMEHASNVAVVPFAGQWSDVGSWNAVAELTDSDAEGNRIDGKGFVHDAHNTYIHAPHRTVVALGTENLLIVDTADALLVANATHAEQVKGTAEVTNGDQVLLLTENQSTYIPLGQVHRLANPGKVPLEIIEVQSGSYLGEDDIVRLEDTYGRTYKK